MGQEVPWPDCWTHWTVYIDGSGSSLTGLLDTLNCIYWWVRKFPDRTAGHTELYILMGQEVPWPDCWTHWTVYIDGSGSSLTGLLDTLNCIYWWVRKFPDRTAGHTELYILMGQEVPWPDRWTHWTVYIDGSGSSLTGLLDTLNCIYWWVRKFPDWTAGHTELYILMGQEVPWPDCWTHWTVYIDGSGSSLTGLLDTLNCIYWWVRKFPDRTAGHTELYMLMGQEVPWPDCWTHWTVYIDGLVQERRNSSMLAMELHLLCINPSISTKWKMVQGHLQTEWWLKKQRVLDTYWLHSSFAGVTEPRLGAGGGLCAGHGLTLADTIATCTGRNGDENTIRMELPQFDIHLLFYLT